MRPHPAHIPISLLWYREVPTFPPPPTPFSRQFVASPSLVTFARVYMALSKVTKMESQRDEASQRLVKHYIIIVVSLRSFP